MIDCAPVLGGPIVVAMATVHRDHKRSDSHGAFSRMLITTGYYTGETFKPAPRGDIQSLIHWDRW